MPLSNVCPRCNWDGLKRTCRACRSRRIVRAGGVTTCGACKMTSFCPCMDDVGERYYCEEAAIYADDDEPDDEPAFSL